MKLREAILARDATVLREHMAWRGLELTDEECEEIFNCYEHQGRYKLYLYQDDDSNIMWIKQRYGSYLGPSAVDNSIWLGCLLHVFLVYVLETVEMVKRLRNEDVQCSSVARSKIGSTLLVITPIDKTAYNVAPTE